MALGTNGGCPSIYYELRIWQGWYACSKPWMQETVKRCWSLGIFSRAAEREGHESIAWAASLGLRALGQTLRALGHNRLSDCYPSEVTYGGQMTQCALHTALLEEKKKVMHVVFLHWAPSTSSFPGRLLEVGTHCSTSPGPAVQALRRMAHSQEFFLGLPVSVLCLLTCLTITES